MGNNAQPCRGNSCCRLRCHEGCWSWGNPFANAGAERPQVLFMRNVEGRIKPAGRSETEESEQQYLPSAGKGLRMCLCCFQGHTSASVFSVTMLGSYLASLLAPDMPGDTGLWNETGSAWPGCEPGDQQEDQGPPFDMKELPGWPGVPVVPARALGARNSCYCLAKGGVEAQQWWCILLIHLRISTAQCIISFSSKWKENMQPHILRCEEEIMPVDFLCYFHHLSCY